MGKRAAAFKVFERERFRCAYCGRPSSRCTLEVDHIFPKSKGGPDYEWNLAAACERCNGGKNDSVPESLPDALIERMGKAWSLLSSFDSLGLKIVGIGTYEDKVIDVSDADEKIVLGLLSNRWKDGNHPPFVVVKTTFDPPFIVVQLEEGLPPFAVFHAPKA